MDNYYYTDSVEMAIQCVAGNVPGYRVARLAVGKQDTMFWDYELKLTVAKKYHHLKPREKMNSLLAREYVYSVLKKRHLPEFIKDRIEQIAELKSGMVSFSNFMDHIALGKSFKKSSLLAKIKRFLPSVEVDSKMTIKEILAKIR